ncbi:MAG: hypothetical protein AAGE59_23235 [Cyanobacteria bacterium P01_F01_bin.86]
MKKWGATLIKKLLTHRLHRMKKDIQVELEQPSDTVESETELSQLEESKITVLDRDRLRYIAE